MKKAVVLVSGGMDSAVVQAIASERGFAVHALSVRYGQRHTSGASVVVERLTGFLVLPFITLVALIGNPTLLQLGQASRLALALALGTLAALVVILVLVASPRVGERFAGRSFA